MRSACYTSGVPIIDANPAGVNSEGFITHLAAASSSELLASSPPHKITSIPAGSFLLPNFCDLHLHAPQFLYQGTGLDLPLMEWLDKYAYRAEERIDADRALARRVYTALAARLIEHGTGCVLLFGTIKPETKCVFIPCFPLSRHSC